jgi:predicted CDP-diglyceride synthetase/phosphatidate cytidylyltransferase
MALLTAGAAGFGGLVMKALKKDAGVRYWGNRSSITGAVGLLDRIAVLCCGAGAVPFGALVLPAAAGSMMPPLVQLPC